MGVFATRSPQRPNPIALSVAQVLRIDQEAGRIWIAYSDAEPGTPVLDLKPLYPQHRPGGRAAGTGLVQPLAAGNGARRGI